MTDGETDPRRRGPGPIRTARTARPALVLLALTITAVVLLGSVPMTPPLPPTRGSGGASAPEETSAAVLRTFSSDRSFVGASPQPIDPTSLALPSAIVVRNASAIPEPGATLGSISVGQSPVGVAYDPSDGLVYVTDFGGGAVTALNGTTEVATIPVGTDPYGVTYDPFDQQVYVTNNGADSVSVLRGTSVVSTISLPPSSSPEGIAADPYNGEVYVADSGTDNVSVLSSGAIAATVRVGTAPDGVAYHSGNGDMYVANNQANTVSVINGTTVVKTITVGSSPGGLAYDPVSSLMYVADLAGGNVTALLGMASFATIKVGSGPDGVAFDPANGFAYVSNRGSNTVSALNRTTVSATLSVGTYPEGLAYYPPTGSLFVADNSVDTLSIVSTVLVETPSVITDRGSDVTATDVNQSVLVSSFLPGLGAGGETVRYHVDPSPGFGCGTQVNFSVPNGIGVLNLSCVPTAVGIYTIWLNVTDADANTVWTYFSIPVEPALLVPAPQVSALVLSGTPSADVNQSVNLDVRPSGGSGVYLVYQWFGLPGTGCSGTSGATVTCRFPSPGTFAPAVEVIDSNLAVTVGSSTSLTIYPDPMAPPPVANRSAWDVGQSVRFTETPRGGPGTFNAYTWSGLSPSTCTALTSSSPVCRFDQAGPLSISVNVTDAAGGRAASPAVRFNVGTLPVVGSPTSNRSAADLGESVTFEANASGGSGSLNYSWQGLPARCTGTTGPTPSCVVSTTGILTVWPIVTDAAGGSVASAGTVSLLVYSDPKASAPTVSPGAPVQGSSMTIQTIVLGGSGNESFVWSGLPPGCHGTTAVVTCSPSSSGSFSVSVAVRDSTGFRTLSPTTVITVASPLAAPFGIPAPLFYGGLGGAVIAVALAVVWFRRRRTPRAPSEAPTEPDPLEVAEPADLPD